MRRKFFLLAVFLIVGVSFVSAYNVCCEKTKDGDYCAYTDITKCDESAKITSATCEQTSYCKLGCCFNSNDGRCFRNTPKAKCVSYLNSTWNPSSTCNIDQCNKGCCVIAGECSFVTQTRCKAEASRYMYVNMTFNEEIVSERECIEQCLVSEEGCCVASDKCTFTTRDKCDIKERNNETGEGFYENMLCSNDLLTCDCARQQYTSCVADKDGVYWFDSCGNRENVYNSDKVKSYNRGYVLDPDSVCSLNGINDVNCGNCDYESGTLCGKVDKKIGMIYGEYSCNSLNCDDVYESKASPNANGDKKNGESWCVYDGAVGQAKDLVGSRHYRHMCINGEEMTESCRDFREEVCIQGASDKPPSTLLQALQETGDYVESACRDNRWETCYACNDELDPQKCCTNIYMRDCYWMLSGISEGSNGVCVPEVPPGIAFWPSDSLNVIESSTRNTGAAVSTGDLVGAPTNTGGVSSGSSGSSICSQADQECVVKWYRGGWAKLLGKENWKCVENCQCTEASWVIAGNDLCKSLGDCGAYYNILGKGTIDGYVNTASVENDYFSGYTLKLNDVGEWHSLVTPSGKNEIKKPNMMMGLMGMAGVGLLSAMLDGEEINLNTILGSAFGGVGGALENNYIWPLLTGALNTAGGALNKDGTKKTNGFGDIFGTGNKAEIEEAQTKFDTTKNDFTISVTDEKGETKKYDYDQVKSMTDDERTTLFEGKADDKSKYARVSKAENDLNELKSENTRSKGLVKAANTALLIYTVYAMIESMGEYHEETYTIECNVWVAPDGGDDCSKCNGDPNKPCSKYRCKSLGQLCELINEGEKEEMCVSIHPNDASSPIIKPWYTLLEEKGYRVNEITEDTGKGFEIKGTSEDTIDPFSIVTLGIQLNEPAQCKISMEHSKKFEEMKSFFGNEGAQLFTYNKSMLFNIPQELTEEQALKLTNGGEYKFYVKCKDRTGNVNNKDYIIKFKIATGPDMTPPVVEATSVVNGAYVKAGQKELELTIYLNEQAECKWANNDTGYDVMSNVFDCGNKGLSSANLYYGLYECNTLLNNIKTEDETNFYIRCKDQPRAKEERRNINEESFVFSVRASSNLSILSVSPQGILHDFTQSLTVVTYGGAQDGNAKCYYGPYGTNQTRDMIEFFDTNTSVHKQPLTDMPTGDYHLNILCMDIAGNEDIAEATFTLEFDKSAPKLRHVYEDVSVIHIELDESATCKYTSNLRSDWTGSTSTGSIHEISTDAKKLYFECTDQYSNTVRYTIYP